MKMLIVEQQANYSATVSTTPCKPHRVNNKTSMARVNHQQTTKTSSKPKPSTPKTAAASSQPRKIDVNEFLSMFAPSNTEQSQSDSETTKAKSHRRTQVKKTPTPVVKQPHANTVHRAASFTNGAVSAKVAAMATPPRTLYTAYATPAYAHSPSAKELPPPPFNWTCGAAEKPKLTQAKSLYSAKPLTGIEFLSVLATN